MLSAGAPPIKTANKHKQGAIAAARDALYNLHNNMANKYHEVYYPGSVPYNAGELALKRLEDEIINAVPDGFTPIDPDALSIYGDDLEEHIEMAKILSEGVKNGD